ncbi:MAG: hypothetical protein AB7K68_17605 [Bacteriovoracia bacterium]
MLPKLSPTKRKTLKGAAAGGGIIIWWLLNQVIEFKDELNVMKTKIAVIETKIEKEK